MSHFNLGYARVSTLQQDEALQRDALQAAGCDRIFVDQGLRQARVPAGPGRAAGPGPARRHSRGLASRPARTVAATPDGGRRPPPAPGRGLREPDREHRHQHPGRAPGLPRLRCAGGVRAGPHSGKDRSRAGGCSCSRSGGRETDGLDRAKLRTARAMHASGEHDVATIARVLGCQSGIGLPRPP